MVIQMTELSGKKMIIANELYEYLHSQISDIIHDPAHTDLMTVFKIVTICASNVEFMMYDDKKLKGTVKKQIVVYLANKFVEDLCPEYMYASLSDISCNLEEILENTIDFAKNNKLIKKASFCFPKC